MYVELVNVYEEYSELGMQVVAFPCSQFLDQEPGTREEIKDYARNVMGASFPLMEKCNVNGPDAHEVFKQLRKKTKCFTNP
jgi:glutathione peroxidase